MKKMFSEFKQFALTGNVMDMAVGIIIGAAFGKIVSSFVADILMPPIGLMVGGINFSQLTVTLRAATGETPAVSINYGAFLNTVIDFILIAFAIFMLVKMINRLRKAEAKKPAETPQEIKLLREIRDALKK